MSAEHSLLLEMHLLKPRKLAAIPVRKDRFHPLHKTLLLFLIWMGGIVKWIQLAIGAEMTQDAAPSSKLPLAPRSNQLRDIKAGSECVSFVGDDCSDLRSVAGRKNLHDSEVKIRNDLAQSRSNT